MIPLMVRGQRMGLVVLSHPGVYEWSELGLRPYHATAAQLAIAIDSRMQQRLLYDRGQQLAVLQERERLARELHDSVTQLIFSTTLIAQSIEPAWKRDPKEGQRRIDRMLELSQMALREMRSLLFELRLVEEVNPPTLTGPERVRRYGLLEALHLLAGDFTQDGVRVSVRTYEYSSTPAGNIMTIEQDIYRIVQEALNNATKHARAQEILVLLDGSEPRSLCISISDDGVGFVPGVRDGSQAGGFGMKTMRQRAEALGGSLRVISAPGHGTTVEVTIPRAS
jgi:signal transduction histidine kinase